ncbi:MAG: hypothetical protein R6V06_09795 [Kiritimatiellia bacterium]
MKSEVYKTVTAGKVMLAATLCTGTVLAGDGSDEPGFVPPPKNRQPPPAPPRTISSAETTDPCCCCPVTPQARTEAKKPPQPPALITKLKTEDAAPLKTQKKRE